MMIQFFKESFAQGLGWTLLHFIWQGALVALLVAAANFALRRSSANARYLSSCGGLLLMAILPIVTLAIFTSNMSGVAKVSDTTTISAPIATAKQPGPA